MPYCTALLHCFVSAMPYIQPSSSSDVPVSSTPVRGWEDRPLICTMVSLTLGLTLSGLGAAYDLFEAVYNTAEWQCVGSSFNLVTFRLSSLVTHSLFNVIPSLCNLILCGLFTTNSMLQQSSASTGPGMGMSFRRDALASCLLLIGLWFPYSFFSLCSLQQGDFKWAHVARILLCMYWLGYPLLKMALVPEHMLLMKTLISCHHSTVTPVEVGDTCEMHFASSCLTEGVGKESSINPSVPSCDSQQGIKTTGRRKKNRKRAVLRSQGSYEKCRQEHRLKRVGRGSRRFCKTFNQQHVIRSSTEDNFRGITPRLRPRRSNSLRRNSLLNAMVVRQMSSPRAKLSVECSDVESLQMPPSIINLRRNSSWSHNPSAFHSCSIKSEDACFSKRSISVCSYMDHSVSSISEARIPQRRLSGSEEPVSLCNSKESVRLCSSKESVRLCRSKESVRLCSSKESVRLSTSNESARHMFSPKAKLSIDGSDVESLQMPPSIINSHVTPQRNSCFFSYPARLSSSKESVRRSSASTISSICLRRSLSAPYAEHALLSKMPFPYRHRRVSCGSEELGSLLQENPEHTPEVHHNNYFTS